MGSEGKEKGWKGLRRMGGGCLKGFWTGVGVGKGKSGSYFVGWMWEKLGGKRDGKKE